MFCSAESPEGIVAGDIGNQRINDRVWLTSNGTAIEGLGVTMTGSWTSPSADFTEPLTVPVARAISALVFGPFGPMSKCEPSFADLDRGPSKPIHCSPLRPSVNPPQV